MEKVKKGGKPWKNEPLYASRLGGNLKLASSFKEVTMGVI